MDGVLRACAMYLFLLVVFRAVGKRSLASITTFDFVLLLIIGEATQQALIGNDFSMTNAFVVIITLLVLDLALSLAKQRWPGFERIIDDVPVVLVADGKLLRDRMRNVRVDEKDILSAARENQGLVSLEQIKYAVLERGGGISIIPKRDDED